MVLWDFLPIKTKASPHTRCDRINDDHAKFDVMLVLFIILTPSLRSFLSWIYIWILNICKRTGSRSCQTYIRWGVVDLWSWACHLR